MGFILTETEQRPESRSSAALVNAFIAERVGTSKLHFVRGRFIAAYEQKSKIFIILAGKTMKNHLSIISFSKAYYSKGDFCIETVLAS